MYPLRLSSKATDSVEKDAQLRPVREAHPFGGVNAKRRCFFVGTLLSDFSVSRVNEQRPRRCGEVLEC